MAEPRKRLDFIDYAKAIGIILVVIGHINVYNSSCKAWIYAFHMPLFFLLSGLLLKPSDNFKAFINKKARRIMVPYFIWGLISAAFSLENLLCVCYGSHQTLYRADTLSSLWFFPVLFVSYIISEVVINVASKRNMNPLIQKILWGGE